MLEILLDIIELSVTELDAPNPDKLINIQGIGNEKPTKNIK